MSQSRNVTYLQIGASSGVVAPIVAFTCILVSIASYPQFSWTNNALSDLGVVAGITGSLFNFGLFASGLLAFNFAVFGLFGYFGNNWVGKIGTVVFAGAAVALMAIGGFNEHFSPTHYFVSVAFFVLAPISLFIVTCAFAVARQRRMAAFSLLVGVVAALPWILEFTLNYVPGVAIPETVSGLAVSAWAIVTGRKILKESRETVKRSIS